MTPRGCGADCMGIGPDVGHWPMRLRAGLRPCREGRAPSRGLPHQDRGQGGARGLARCAARHERSPGVQGI
jgi:hypothetical protein